MILKHIRCEIYPDKKIVFSNGQSAWQESSVCRGFLGQIGSWEKDTSIAHLFCFWVDFPALESFMNDHHDPIEKKANQLGTYSDIKISNYENFPCDLRSLENLNSETVEIELQNDSQMQVPMLKKIGINNPPLNWRRFGSKPIRLIFKDENTQQLRSTIVQIMNDWSIPMEGM